MSTNVGLLETPPIEPVIDSGSPGAATDGETWRVMLVPSFGVPVYTIETATGFFTFNAPVSIWLSIMIREKT